MLAALAEARNIDSTASFGEFRARKDTWPGRLLAAAADLELGIGVVEESGPPIQAASRPRSECVL